MKKLNPFLRLNLLEKKISYIMSFVEFLEIELALSDLKASVTDLDDLFDEKNQKE